LRKKKQVIFLGDSGVGKTALKDAYCNGFSYNTVQTIGLEFYTKQITRNSESFKIKIWDTAGQERYRAIPRP
jgi:small GTP-binding protein